MKTSFKTITPILAMSCLMAFNSATGAFAKNIEKTPCAKDNKKTEDTSFKNTDSPFNKVSFNTGKNNNISSTIKQNHVQAKHFTIEKYVNNSGINEEIDLTLLTIKTPNSEIGFYHMPENSHKRESSAFGFFPESLQCKKNISKNLEIGLSTMVSLISGYGDEMAPTFINDLYIKWKPLPFLDISINTGITPALFGEEGNQKIGAAVTLPVLTISANL